MKKALILSPNLDGHRQVYVFVATHVLEELGFGIIIAGNLNQKVSNTFYLDKLREKRNRKFLDTSGFSGGGINITLKELREIQTETGADLTFFCEADHHLDLLASQITERRNRLAGRTVGIFLRPFYFYRSLSIYERLRYLKYLPREWKGDERFFHSTLMRCFRLLDTPLYIDENFVGRHGYSQWLPDVFQEYADSVVRDEKADQRIWIERLNEFRNKNNGRFIFFYFGTAQPRRGYDELLKLAVDYEGCFVHCGLRSAGSDFRLDTDTMRSALAREGRIFETDQYIADPECVDYFFRSVSHLILPYRNFYGSSGVMLQALACGIPVLAPSDGIMGYRIRKHKLGMTYDENDPESFEKQFRIFRSTDPSTYRASISSYMKHQTAGMLEKVLKQAITGTGEKVREP